MIQDRTKHRGSARLAFGLAALLLVSGCQSGFSGQPGSAGNSSGMNYASARRGGIGNRVKPLDLTLEPGVTYGGCLVVESVQQDNADFGLGLVC